MPSNAPDGKGAGGDGRDGTPNGGKPDEHVGPEATPNNARQRETNNARSGMAGPRGVAEETASDATSGLMGMFQTLAMTALGFPPMAQLAIKAVLTKGKSLTGMLGGKLGQAATDLAGLTGIPGMLASQFLGKKATGFMNANNTNTPQNTDPNGGMMMDALASRSAQPAMSVAQLSPQAQSLMNIPTFGYQQKPIMPPVQQPQGMFKPPTFGYQQQLPRSTDTWA